MKPQISIESVKESFRGPSNGGPRSMIACRRMIANICATTILLCQTAGAIAADPPNLDGKHTLAINLPGLNVTVRPAERNGSLVIAAPGGELEVKLSDSSGVINDLAITSWRDRSLPGIAIAAKSTNARGEHEYFWCTCDLVGSGRRQIVSLV